MLERPGRILSFFLTKAGEEKMAQKRHTKRVSIARQSEAERQYQQLLRDEAIGNARHRN